jgi:hypothetical protein
MSNLNRVRHVRENALKKSTLYKCRLFFQRPTGKRKKISTCKFKILKLYLKNVDIWFVLKFILNAPKANI